MCVQALLLQGALLWGASVCNQVTTSLLLFPGLLAGVRAQCDRGRACLPGPALPNTQMWRVCEWQIAIKASEPAEAAAGGHCVLCSQVPYDVLRSACDKEDLQRFEAFALRSFVEDNRRMSWWGHKRMGDVLAVKILLTHATARALQVCGEGLRGCCGGRHRPRNR